MRSLLLVLLAAGLASLGIMHQVRSADPAHLLQSECISCHLSQGDVSPENAHKLIADQEKLCETCHPRAQLASHPSGITPTQTLPLGFPLDWKGEMTCSTCHLIHGHQAGLMRTELRGRDYCYLCHEEAFFDRMADGGVTLMVSGHLVATASAIPANTGNIDEFSLQCMLCHAEQEGTLRVSINDLGVMDHASKGLNHPVGVDYVNAAQSGGYHPVTSLPEVIQLPEGRISCISCHQSYSQQHGQLVADTKGSQLCFHCHDL
jgi:predicted CXXCH cytochrome family protein